MGVDHEQRLLAAHDIARGMLSATEIAALKQMDEVVAELESKFYGRPIDWGEVDEIVKQAKKTGEPIKLTDEEIAGFKLDDWIVTEAFRRVPKAKLVESILFQWSDGLACAGYDVNSALEYNQPI